MARATPSRLRDRAATHRALHQGGQRLLGEDTAGAA